MYDLQIVDWKSNLSCAVQSNFKINLTVLVFKNPDQGSNTIVKIIKVAIFENLEKLKIVEIANFKIFIFKKM